MSEKDLTQTVSSLCATFNEKISKLPKAFRHKTQGPNQAYKLQTEFAYLLNDLMQGPRCLQQKYVAAINEFIANVPEEDTQPQSEEKSS